MEHGAEGLLGFIDNSPSPYHAVDAARRMLRAARFAELHESEAWNIEPGRGYFATRGGKTLIAWRQGTGSAAQHGFRIVAAHSDSPVLKLRPKPGRAVRNVGYFTTEIYGSPLLHTWLDRDLKLAGAVYHREGQAGIGCVLVDLSDVRLRAISLAPHLKRENRTNGVLIDVQKDLPIAYALNEGELFERLQSQLLEKSGVSPSRVLSLDLNLTDTQQAEFVGAAREFISAPRLDNLFSSYCAIAALIDSAAPSDHTSIAILYDCEEIGSHTWTGAASNFVDSTLQRLSRTAGSNMEEFWRAKSRSVVISADMAHAEHPSFPDATDPDHVPEINRGIAVKSSAKGNYAIGHPASAWFAMLCQDAGIPLQRFMYRCDHGGGSSVGPVISTGLGICGVDVGAPMLAMHSLREFAGAHDVDHAIRAFAACFSSKAGFGG